MDGQVNVSILQWEQQREELKVLREKNAELKDGQKEIKLTVVEKNAGGHYKYNRWTNQNEFCPESHMVETVIYTNLSKVQDILLDEAKDAVNEKLTNHALEINELNGRITEIKSNNDLENRKISENHSKELSNLKESHKSKINSVEASHEQVIKDKNKKIDELNDKLDDKVRVNKEAERIQELQDLKDRIKILEGDKTKMVKDISIWKRHKYSDKK